VSIGVFVAFTPTLGFQILLATLVATLLGANRPAAIVPTFLTNPFTAPPVYAFEYWLGHLVLGGPPVSRVREAIEAAVLSISQRDLADVSGRARLLLEMGADVYGATFFGGCVVGAALAVPSYALTLRAVRAHRRRRLHRRGRRRRSGARR
jgi:uncharacterized protein (DUF2062 family)